MLLYSEENLCFLKHGVILRKSYGNIKTIEQWVWLSIYFDPWNTFIQKVNYFKEGSQMLLPILYFSFTKLSPKKIADDGRVILDWLQFDINIMIWLLYMFFKTKLLIFEIEGQPILFRRTWRNHFRFSKNNPNKLHYKLWSYTRWRRTWTGEIGCRLLW
jgi:hypothetical protein